MIPVICPAHLNYSIIPLHRPHNQRSNDPFSTRVCSCNELSNYGISRLQPPTPNSIHTMSSAFAANLPLELRQQIYLNLFQTPKGRIELQKTSYRAFGRRARYRVKAPAEDGGQETFFYLSSGHASKYTPKQSIYCGNTTLLI